MAVPGDLHFRMIVLGIFAAALAISTYFRMQARKSGEVIHRRREGAPAMILRATMALPLLVVILLYALHPRWLDWSTMPVPMWARWLGVALGLACLPLLWCVFVSIGSNISETVLTKKDHRLVTEGPYRWVRHPLYSVAFLEIFAFSLIAANWLMGLMSLAGVLIFRCVVIPREEANLVALFGAGYEQYRRSTGALAPRLMRAPTKPSLP